LVTTHIAPKDAIYGVKLHMKAGFDGLPLRPHRFCGRHGGWVSTRDREETNAGNVDLETEGEGKVAVASGVGGLEMDLVDLGAPEEGELQRVQEGGRQGEVADHNVAAQKGKFDGANLNGEGCQGATEVPDAGALEGTGREQSYAG
jgi:hypothetical protein